MKLARRRWIAVIIGAAPLVPLASSSCSTNLSYTYVEPEAGADSGEARPPPVVPNPCGLVVNPNIVNFGGLLPGKPLTRTISVRNLQTTERIVDVRSADSRFTGQPAQFRIGPSDTTTVQVIGQLDDSGETVVTAALTLVSSLARSSDGGSSDDGGEAGAGDAGEGATCTTTVKLEAARNTRGRQIGPQPLDFGSVACNSTPAAQVLTITSVNADPASYTAAVPSPFAIAAPAGNLEANGALPITVTAGAIGPPAGVLDRLLSLTIINNAGGAPQTSTIDVKATAVGANVYVTPNALLFIDKNPLQAEIENTGNKRVEVELSAGASYKISSVATGGTTIALEPFGFAGSAAKVKVTPATSGTPPANVPVTAIEKSGTLCVFGGFVLKYATNK